MKKYLLGGESKPCLKDTFCFRGVLSDSASIGDKKLYCPSDRPEKENDPGGHLKKV